MKYKIYTLVHGDEGAIQVVESKEFEDEFFSTVEEAYVQIDMRGSGVVCYTILPFITIP